MDQAYENTILTGRVINIETLGRELAKLEV